VFCFTNAIELILYSVGEVALIPQRDVSGTFIVRVNGKIIWDRTQESTKGFPEAKTLKQLIRDEISPEKSLGHSDKK
jgi:selenoprotein W-related protein